ncbi:MAG: hypothetical protein IJW38_01250 [Clostridia bacterium]|nr:hypothetical protein [Clostridia bacterium]
MKYYLGIDLGTTGTKTILFDETGKALGKGYKSYDLISSDGGFFEERAEDWYDAVVETVRMATENFSGEISAMSFSAQGGSFLFCDVKNGKPIPLTKAITWMDRRAAKEAEALKDSYFAITGKMPNSSSMLAKYLWVKNNMPKAFENTKYVLSTSDYIYMKITGKAVIDYTSAAMMGVYNTAKNSYDERLLSLVGLDESRFPKIVTAGDFIGYANEEFLERTGLSGNISVYAGLHDQFAASLGANYFGKGDVIISTGTTWVVFGRNEKMLNGIFASRRHPAGDFGYFISAVSSGVVLEWEKSLFGLSYKEMDELAAARPIDENLLVYPFVSGNGEYRGPNVLNFSVKNASKRHENGDIFRATLEGVAFEIKEIFTIYEANGFKIDNVIVTGGATRSGIWMQILSDVLGRKLYLSEEADGCCLGAFSVARRGDVGEFFKFCFTGKTVGPNMENTLKYVEKFNKYNENLK